MTIAVDYDFKHFSARPKIAALQLRALIERKIKPYRFGEECRTALEAINVLIGAYGVEFAILANGDELSYCNMGDSYAPTIMQFDGGPYIVDSFASIVEWAEKDCWENASQQEKALSRHLNVPIWEVSECAYGQEYYQAETESGVYRILTQKEADEAFRESVDEYVDDCLDIPPNIVHYFDVDKYARDIEISDGRGPSLAPYDSIEEEVAVDGVTFFLYRVE